VFVAGKPNNEYYNYILEKAKKQTPDFHNYQSIGSVLLNKEFPTVKSIKDKFPMLNVDNIAFETIYSYYPMQYIPKIFETDSDNRMNSYSIGIHWYAGHSSAGKFLNIINHMNYKYFVDTPIGSIIKEVMEK